MIRPATLLAAVMFTSPVQGLFRKTVEEVGLGGVRIPAGARPILMYGSANRDEGHFVDAERMEPRRRNAREHFAFGGGIHYCLGAPLARLEAKVAFETVLGRLHNLRLAPGANDFTHTPSFTLRGLRALHIEFDAA